MLYRKLGKKDKDELDDKDREVLKQYSWLDLSQLGTGNLDLCSGVSRVQPWRADIFFQYFNIIYKDYMGFIGSYDFNQDHSHLSWINFQLLHPNMVYHCYQQQKFLFIGLDGNENTYWWQQIQISSFLGFT